MLLPLRFWLFLGLAFKTSLTFRLVAQSGSSSAGFMERLVNHCCMLE
jgi:hypothetical protein